MGSGPNKLDLEFEDEEEIRAREQEKKKKEQVEDVDLEFDLGEDSYGGSLSQIYGERSSPERSIQNFDQEKASNTQSGTFSRQSNVRSLKPTHQEEGSASLTANYRLGEHLEQSISTSRVLQVEMHASVQIAVLEAKMEFLAKQAQDAKLLEYKVGKLVNRIYKKAPSVKAELISIKKLLSRHSQVRNNDESKEKKDKKNKKAS